jgi:hypothetical protein
MLKDGTLAGDEVRRVNYMRRIGEYIYFHKRDQIYRVYITRKVFDITYRAQFKTYNEAEKAVNDLFNSIEDSYFKYSMCELKTFCNCENHSSIIHARRTVQNLIETDKSFRAKAQIIFEKISNNQIIIP